jgi:uncharacterized membrane protein
MTAAAEASHSAQRRAWALWIALALSLTLNVFMLGGLFWSMFAPPRPALAPAERLVAAARTLDLDPSQQSALEQFDMNSRDIHRTLVRSNAPVFRQLGAEMVKPQPDPAVIQKLSDQAIDNRRVFQRDMTANLMKLLATLSPDQRQRFADIAMHRPGAPAHHP